MNMPITDITLAITPSCPHCPSMLEVLSQFVKNGDIGSLRIVNIAQQNTFATDNQIRSVPWLKIGPFILQGLYSAQEIKTWLTRSQSEQGMSEYFIELLSNGELDTVSHALKQSPPIIKLLVPLISSDETNINVRLGIGAILEDLSGQPILENILTDLIELLTSTDARVRGDAAHFLSFIKSTDAIKPLQQCLNDADEDVREIAQESLETLATDQS